MTGLGLVVGVWDLRFIRFLQRGGVFGVSGFPGSRRATFTPVVSRVFLKAFPGRNFFCCSGCYLVIFCKGGGVWVLSYS